MALGVGVVWLKETEPLSVKCTSLNHTRFIHDLSHIGERLLRKVVPVPSERTVDEPSIRKGAVVAHDPIAGAVVPLRVYRFVGGVERGPRDVIGVRRVTENRGLESVAIIDLESQLSGVVIGCLRAVYLPIVQSKEGRRDRVAVGIYVYGWRHVLVIDAGIEISEIEEMVP